MNFKQEFQQKGVTVVPSVIPDTSEYSSEFWSWLESFESGVDRNVRETWSSKYWPPTRHGILQHFRIGHADFMWKLRTQRSIIEKFQELYSVEELLVSFDGANASFPNQRKKTSNWGHIDQRQSKVGFHCVQGSVALSESNAKFVVLKGSHLLHQKFFEAFPAKIGSKDWVPVHIDEYKWYIEQGCEEVEICARSGDLVLWDSRLVHWVIAPTDNVRLVAYISYEPKSRSSKAMIDKRKKYFKDSRTTSHWSANPRVNAKVFQHYGNRELLEKFPDRPVVKEHREEILKLVGY